MMTAQFSYRDATTADIDQLILLGLASYGQYAAELTTENLERMRGNLGNTETWAGILDTGKGFVCTAEDKIIGMAFLIPSGNAWDIFKPEWSYIRMVAVDPACQGMGIAKKLMQQCVQHARHTNEQVVALHTSEKMHAARHIYEKMGFKVLYEVPQRLGWRYWLYTLDL